MKEVVEEKIERKVREERIVIDRPEAVLFTANNKFCSFFV